MLHRRAGEDFFLLSQFKPANTIIEGYHMLCHAWSKNLFICKKLLLLCICSFDSLPIYGPWNVMVRNHSFNWIFISSKQHPIIIPHPTGLVKRQTNYNLIIKGKGVHLGIQCRNETHFGTLWEFWCITMRQLSK